MIYSVPNVGPVVLWLKTPEHKQGFLDLLALAEKGGRLTDEFYRLKQLVTSHLQLQADLKSPPKRAVVLEEAEVEG